MEQITILLAAGDPSLLHGVRMRLEVEPGFDIAGQARLGEVVALAGALAPDVVVIDADSVERSGPEIELVRTLATAHRVVVVSLDDRQVTSTAVSEAGAAAFVRKHDGTGALVDAIRSAARDAGREAR